MFMNIPTGYGCQMNNMYGMGGMGMYGSGMSSLDTTTNHLPSGNPAGTSTYNIKKTDNSTVLMTTLGIAAAAVAGILLLKGKGKGIKAPQVVQEIGEAGGLKRPPMRINLADPLLPDAKVIAEDAKKISLPLPPEEGIPQKITAGKFNAPLESIESRTPEILNTCPKLPESPTQWTRRTGGTWEYKNEEHLKEYLKRVNNYIKSNPDLTVEQKRAVAVATREEVANIRQLMKDAQKSTGMPIPGCPPPPPPPAPLPKGGSPLAELASEVEAIDKGIPSAPPKPAPPKPAAPIPVTAALTDAITLPKSPFTIIEGKKTITPEALHAYHNEYKPLFERLEGSAYRQTRTAYEAEIEKIARHIACDLPAESKTTFLRTFMNSSPRAIDRNITETKLNELMSSENPRQEVYDYLIQQLKAPGKKLSQAEVDALLASPIEPHIAPPGGLPHAEVDALIATPATPKMDVGPAALAMSPPPQASPEVTKRLKLLTKAGLRDYTISGSASISEIEQNFEDWAARFLKVDTKRLTTEEIDELQKMADKIWQNTNEVIKSKKKA